MQFSEKWLREWVNPPVDTSELAEQLTMAGLEVDSVIPAASEFNGVVVGHVISTEQHPDADRLRVCKVDVGNNEILEIVCGGQNVRADLKVAVVKVGGRLAGDFKIKKSKLRGVMSHGMICSERELGLSDQDKGGILELPNDAPIGLDFREYLQLDDHCIDIDLTPNRGDCASIRGIARELGTINKIKSTAPTISAQRATIKDTFPVTLMAKKACPRYVGRVIRDINNDVETPMWMQERLRRSGLRSIHPVVDITNYVMLELGQPLHAFDLEKLDKGIEVRMAKRGEKITLLDGQERELNDQTLIIADHKQPQAIAGVMGGDSSAVNESTRHLFLESAFFVPAKITLSARHYGLSTDSSYRFERRVDYELQAVAIERLTALLLEIVGGEAGPLIEEQSTSDLPVSPKIQLRRDQIKRLLGITLNDSDVESILMSLGMALKANKTGWEVTPPSYRFDLTIEADIIEELARLYGYNNIPARQMSGEYSIPVHSEAKIPVPRLMRSLVDRGYHQAITYSFVDSKLQSLIDPETKPIPLVNPIASDMNVMRTSLWPGLLKTLQYNQNRQIQRVRLFELGMCFWKEGDDWRQVTKLGGLASGGAHSLQWGESERSVDFFDVKGDVAALLDLTRRGRDFRWVTSSHPALHPGQSAVLYDKERPIGWIGALHPDLVDKLDLSHPPVLFEIDFEAIEARSMPKYHSISKFPAVRRDIAIVVDKEVSAEAIEQKIVESGGHLLNMVQIFDIYAGEHIEFGKKSVALGLTFQDPSRTLIDDEINQVIDSVVAVLEHEFNAKLRA
ncbi:phenylalanine--tRNA ligase subunit beta [Candidiatus Paracoxiella cheracis]|uniref:phenylalanine--tRNA ligase subunit beta n=1 Tax=Candidiatus Paracoxiella cheracis TaxID=3405120 RepID=UPI003BF525DE